MMRNLLATICTLAVVLSSSTALAQLGGKAPVSTTPGYAGKQLQSIYSNGIGNGYTADSQNQLALRQSQGWLPNARLGAGLSTSSAPSRPSASFGGGGFGLSSKPFSSYTPSPTVSPYLNLFREDLDGDDSLNYNTLVRPMLQQQEFNERMQRQSLEMARRLQTMAAQADFNPQGSQSMYPTGHKTTFNNTGRYYPMPAPRR